eukprot:GHRR01035888.1.p4 GENE.GHRR01035888.1~~GHRR01035888.1.p4  ORF type:complete len:101 (+),score=22.70 GHRR01035888.1:1079-1381(+)
MAWRFTSPSRQRQSGHGSCSAHGFLVILSLQLPLLPAACLKDLQRFLRRDDPDLRDVFFKIGELQLVENDIVPLLTVYPTDHELVYQARECRNSLPVASC